MVQVVKHVLVIVTLFLCAFWARQTFAYDRVEENGGRLTAAYEPDGGMRFAITLPIAPPSVPR